MGNQSANSISVKLPGSEGEKSGDDFGICCRQRKAVEDEESFADDCCRALVTVDKRAASCDPIGISSSKIGSGWFIRHGAVLGNAPWNCRAIRRRARLALHHVRQFAQDVRQSRLRSRPRSNRLRHCRLFCEFTKRALALWHDVACYCYLSFKIVSELRNFDAVISRTYTDNSPDLAPSCASSSLCRIIPVELPIFESLGGVLIQAL